MVTVHRQGPFRFYFYSYDHPPAHVHAENGDGVAVIEIATLRVRSIVGMRDRDVLRAVRIVEAEASSLLERWEEFAARRRNE
jgi:hypothetical protein